jgi:hypothetical protein
MYLNLFRTSKCLSIPLVCHHFKLFREMELMFILIVAVVAFSSLVSVRPLQL